MRFLSAAQSPEAAGPESPAWLRNERVSALIESGAVRPVIDRRYELSRLPEALTYVERGQAKGKVVVAL